jgi:hypothetical protein
MTRGNAQGRTHSEASSNYLCTNGECDKGHRLRVCCIVGTNPMQLSGPAPVVDVRCVRRHHLRPSVGT